MDDALFSNEFLKDRRAHLVNKLAATELATKRIGISEWYAGYKVTILIPQIRAAIDRIDQGIYGICRDCREPIPSERLIRHPHVCRCVGCQKQYEDETIPHRRQATTATTSKR